jgi:hypothetical protein
MANSVSSLLHLPYAKTALEMNLIAVFKQLPRSKAILNKQKDLK